MALTVAMEWGWLVLLALRGIRFPWDFAAS
jgi:hypothetical protein